MNEYETATEYYEKALYIRLKLLGERHLGIVTSYNNIASVFAFRREYKKALEYYEKALDIRLEKLGEYHPDVANTYNSIGNIYLNQKCYQKSKEMFAKSIDILKDFVPENHSGIQTSIENLEHVKRLAEVEEIINNANNLKLPVLEGIIQEIYEMFKIEGQITASALEQLVELHIILSNKQKETGEIEAAYENLIQAKRFAQQLGNEELLSLIQEKQKNS